MNCIHLNAKKTTQKMSFYTRCFFAYNYSKTRRHLFKFILNMNINKTHVLNFIYYAVMLQLRRRSSCII
jgi:hypothetical protein